jgi:CheY-like chemotaxis protein
MASVLALVDDLFFQARLQETAQQMGIELETVSTADAFLVRALGRGGSGPSKAGTLSPTLLIVDLNARTGALEALEKLRAAGNQAPVIAFLSHVQVELAERARAAGCQQVLPRSKFTQSLAAILAQAKP